MVRNVVVIGAGIVGTAIAAELADGDRVAVTVIEQGRAGAPVGSTGHAPGYVGILGDTSLQTELARASAAAYDDLNHPARPVFARAGEIEIATSANGEAELHRRAGLARAVGLPARMLDSAEVAAIVPDFVDRGRALAELHFPDDGTADATGITAAYTQRGERAGVRRVHRDAVNGFGTRGNRIASVHTTRASFPADDVVIASGIWSPLLAAMAGFRLPLIPVAHPYVYGPRQASGQAPGSTPFVRWPEHDVYARDHGDRIGLGTYDHEPVPVPPADLGKSAERAWPGATFDNAIETALTVIAEGHRFVPERRLNGVFAMTPDNLPFLGPIPGVEGVWMASAIWVTHAAGAAQAPGDLVRGREPGIGEIGMLDPGRFAREADDDLERRALTLYRDIYATARDDGGSRG